LLNGQNVLLVLAKSFGPHLSGPGCGLSYDVLKIEHFFLSIMQKAIRKNIHNMPQRPPNPGFMQ